MDFLSFRSPANNGVASVHFGKTQTTTNLWGPWYVITNADVIARLRSIAKCSAAGNTQAEAEKIRELKTDFPSVVTIGFPYTRGGGAPHMIPVPISATAVPIPSASIKPTPAVEPTPAPITKEVADARHEMSVGLVKFFSEFSFDVSARFANTLINQKSMLAARRYVTNYCMLSDHPDTDQIAEKIKSPEFETLYKQGNGLATGRLTNSRLEIYFGPAGTGKTTEAIKKYPDANVTVCNETMDSHDLMKVFAFNDENGNPVFKPSALQEDMIAGRPHILDEFNLLPLASMRFLQGLLDNKTEIEFENTKIPIAPGFKIIATMNLVVNGQVFSLPEPIVDRAAVIKEFVADAAMIEAFAF